MSIRRLLLALLCAGFVASHVRAETIRVLPKGQQPNDVRLKPLKHLNNYFPFKVPKTLAAWKIRQRQLRRQILVSAGLFPRPSKTPMHPVIHGKVQRKGFTVEKVYFQSYPNHFVTGLLFRPDDGKKGKRPAVLCPHGHGGRLQNHGSRIKALIKSGDEKFEESGKYPKLARCAQLARMGCVTFIFDMIGYADSVQIPMGVAHRLRKYRPHLDSPQRWGLFTVQSELRLQSILGIQTWNSIRALDFLCGLPDVDAKRVAVTGGSGGGTQTILLGAIDPRPIASFPNGMVSTAMQGGCLCENATLLRVGTGNVELAAVFAPRPQGMTAANDWTRDMMTKGYPELQKLYSLYGKKDDVLCAPQLHFGHNYNYVTRGVMYNWFNKHMKLGHKGPIVEQDYKLLGAKDLTVWNASHPRPKGGEAYEVSLTQYLDDESNRQLAKVYPKNAEGYAGFQEVVGGAFRALVGRGVPKRFHVQRKQTGGEVKDGVEYVWEMAILRHRGEAVPTVRLTPLKKYRKEVVLFVDGQGKDAALTADTPSNKAVQQLLAKGYGVVVCDLFMQGEFTKDGKAVKQARYTQGARAAAVYTFCYNDSLFIRRVHDVLTVAGKLRDDPFPVHVIGANGAGPVVSLASAMMGSQIKKRVIDTGGFRFVNVKSYRDVNFLPGAVKYGDLPAILALSGKATVYVGGEKGELPNIVRHAFQSARGQVKEVKGGLSRLIDAAF